LELQHRTHTEQGQYLLATLVVDPMETSGISTNRIE